MLQPPNFQPIPCPPAEKEAGSIESACLTPDHQCANRLEALALLHQELHPNEPFDAEETLHQALRLGLNQMLEEALVGPEPEERPLQKTPTRHLSHPRQGLRLLHRRNRGASTH